MTQDGNGDEFRDRMTTLGEMAAVLAHEIKNPMNSIIINLEVLKGAVGELAQKSQTPASDKVLRYFEVINDEIRRLDKVIKGFLDLAAPPQPTKHLFSLNHIVTKTVDFVRQEFSKKGVEIELQLQEDLPRILGSSDQIRQALLNLILNAAHAMSDGGKVFIETKSDAKMISLSVRDTGHGINEQIRAKIFSPYFTTKEKGSGLGLAIVRRIVRDHGGFVELQSESGKGACFQLFFPRQMSERV